MVLVVGSQCAALGSLSFLPPDPNPVVEELPAHQRLVADLRDLMVDGPGGCSPVRVDGESAPGLLLNPTQQVADAALVQALAQANEQEAVLVVCFLGHGTRYQADPAAPARHLLHVFDTAARPEGTEPEDRAWDPYETVARRRPKLPNMVGLVLLVDACYASWAKQQVDAWSGVRGGLLAAWLGSSGDHEAFDACFTRTIVTVLEEGLEASQHPRQALVPELLVVDLEPTLGERCHLQAPRLGGYSSHNPVLFLGRNRRASALGASLGLDSATETLLLRLTDHYVSFAVDPVVEAIRQHRVVAVVGRAGSGKSSLAAVLRHPPETAGDVPLSGVHAVVFLHAGSSIPELARSLRSQLECLPIFPEAMRRAEGSNPAAWETMDPWQRLLAVLRLYPDPVRLLLDGLDQLAGQAVHSDVLRVLAGMVADPSLNHVRLVLTGRAVPDLDGIDTTLEMPVLDEATAARYLSARGIQPPLIERVSGLAGGNWLVLKLAADVLASNPGMGTGELPDLYAHLIGQIEQRHGSVVEGLLTMLAAAGTGPVLPFDLLHEGLERLGFPLTRAQLHAILGDPDLHRLLDRTQPGQAGEHIGLFHQTLTEHLNEHPTHHDEALTAPSVHSALADALAVLAPAGKHTPGGYRADPLLAYAFTSGPRHLHLAGRIGDLVSDLEQREDPIPNINLARFSTWLQPIMRATGPEARAVLTMRANLADWTGLSGDPGEALRLSDALLADVTRVLGADDPDTLAVRASIARWTGDNGDVRKALRTCSELLPDLIRILGPDDEHTLRARNNIAYWTGAGGDAAEALRLFDELLPDRMRVQGANDPSTLIARANIAFWTGRVGDPAEALRLYLELLPDRVRVLGPDHPDTLSNRNNIAYWTGKAGDPVEALRLSRALLVDRLRVLGPMHPECLNMRQTIAYWTGKAGDPAGALLQVRELLTDLERVIGPDHPRTLSVRVDLAKWAGESGDPDEALRLYQALLPDQERVLGKEHRYARATRDTIASWGSHGAGP